MSKTVKVSATRREFLSGAAAIGAAPFIRTWGADGDKPLWKAGLMTDTHVGKTMASCSRVRAACELFAKHGVDLVVNCGDIADLYYPTGFQALRKVYSEAFKAKKPEEVWVYANHDRLWRTEPWEEVMKDVRRFLEIPHEPYASIDFKGYPLIVVPQWLDYGRAKAMLDEACAKYADKPIFVFDHIPPQSTTDSSITWGSAERRKFYSAYPRVVLFTGHAHGSLRSELNIWQGGFTTVNLGCLATWSGHAVGGAPKSKLSYDVALLEVYADRLVVRRFDVRDGKEYTDAPVWTVPLPFDPATAPYRRERTAKVEPVPQFASGAKLSVISKGDPCERFELSFPKADGPNGVYIYRLEIEDEKGVRLARQDEFGQFWLSAHERQPILTYSLSAGYFDAGRKYRIVVTPVNCFGVCGRPISAVVKASESNGTLLWESVNPMKECSFMTGLSGGKPVPVKDGWYQMTGGNHRMEIPSEVWNGKKGTRFRFIVDLEMEQFGERTWTVVLRNPNPLKNANARIATPRGRSGKQRYVIEFAKQKDDFRYYLLIREGGAGKLRINRARLERIPGDVR
jgi:hypothetical protein